MTEALDSAVRAAAGRVTAGLAARFRDLDLAEEAFAETCAAAARTWIDAEAPADPAGWLYRVALRQAIDALGRRGVRERFKPEPPDPEPTAEDQLASDTRLIPDNRLRLIFVCCHPAMAPDARAALTLRLVCGLSVEEIAAAFLVPTPTLLQRLTRAKRKIAAAGVPFEVPGPHAWPERLKAVLTTLEVAYAKAHEDAAGESGAAGFAQEIIGLTELLAELMPQESGVLGFAALVRYAEARRPARLSSEKRIVPLCPSRTPPCGARASSMTATAISTGPTISGLSAHARSAPRSTGFGVPGEAWITRPLGRQSFACTTPCWRSVTT